MVIIGVVLPFVNTLKDPDSTSLLSLAFLCPMFNSAG